MNIIHGHDLLARQGDKIIYIHKHAHTQGDGPGAADRGPACTLSLSHTHKNKHTRKVTGEAQPIEVPQSTESCIHARDALSKVTELN
jgi:hypothetical protein